MRTEPGENCASDGAGGRRARESARVGVVSRHEETGRVAGRPARDRSAEASWGCVARDVTIGTPSGRCVWRARARFEPAARRRGNWSVCQVARPRYFRVPPPEARELFTAGRADELKRASRLARRDCPARSLNETRADTQRPASGGGHRVYNAPSNGDSRRLVTGAHGGKGKGGH